MSVTFTKLLQNTWRLGLRESFRRLNKMDDIKMGRLVGTDQFGNEYYENTDDEILGRDRWVMYARKDFDGSQTPPGWNAWLHKMTDAVPDPNEPQPEWIAEYQENQTLSAKAFKTYNTTTPKIAAWDAKAKPRKRDTQA